MNKEAVLAAIEAIHIRAYVARGRTLSDVPSDVLTSMWVDRYKAVVTSESPEAFDAEAEAKAELLIRGLPVPKDLVAVERAAYLATNEPRQPASLEDLQDDQEIAGVIEQILIEIGRRQ